MDNFSKEIKDVLRWSRTGSIANIIARRTGMTPLSALKEFYRSHTWQSFIDPSTRLSLQSNLFIADEYLEEKREKNGHC